MPFKLICSTCHSRNDVDADRCASCGNSLGAKRELTADELFERASGITWEPSSDEYRRLQGLGERLMRDAKWMGVASMFGFEQSTVLGGFLALKYFSEKGNAKRFGEMLNDYRVLLNSKIANTNSYHRQLYRFRRKWSQASDS